MGYSIGYKKRSHTHSTHTLHETRRQVVNSLWETLHVFSQTAMSVGIGLAVVGLFLLLGVFFMSNVEAVRRFYLGPASVVTGLVILGCGYLINRSAKRRLRRYRFVKHR